MYQKFSLTLFQGIFDLAYQSIFEQVTVFPLIPISAYFIKNDVNTFVSFLSVSQIAYLRLYLRNIGIILYNA